MGQCVYYNTFTLISLRFSSSRKEHFTGGGGGGVSQQKRLKVFIFSKDIFFSISNWDSYNNVENTINTLRGHRENERERQTDRQTDRGRQRDTERGRQRGGRGRGREGKGAERERKRGRGEGGGAWNGLSWTSTICGNCGKCQ